MTNKLPAAALLVCSLFAGRIHGQSAYAPAAPGPKPKCTPISVTPTMVYSGAPSNAFAIAVSGTCTWTISTTDNWLTSTDVTADGFVLHTAANTGPARSGSLAVGPVAISVYQEGALGAEPSPAPARPDVPDPDPAPTGQELVVPAGGDLQAALNNVPAGTIIRLTAGATYTGNFVFPAKPGSEPVVVTTTGQMPADGVRASQADADWYAFPRIQAAAGGLPALRMANGARGLILRGVEFLGNPGGYNEIIEIGSGNMTSLAQVPSHITLDRVVIHGDRVRGQKRGITLNGADVTIKNSTIWDIKRTDQDTQAIGGWNGPGPYLIENNYLEASTENLMFGGSDPRIANLVPSDITIRRNHLAKPLEWKRSRWLVKNLFELKNARRVLVEDNLLERVWQDGQFGYAVLLTVRNQDGGCPWCVIEDVTFRKNVLRGMGGGFAILGEDYVYPSGKMARVRIENNLLEDIDPSTWGGAGRVFQMEGGPVDLQLVGNAAHGTNIAAALGFNDPSKLFTRLVITGNNLPEGEYGIHGTDAPALGKPVLDMYAPGYVWQSNIIRRGTSGRSIQYPAGTILQ